MNIEFIVIYSINA